MGRSVRHETVDTEVLIVGGGPVGMLIAAELAAYGVRVAVLESLPGTQDRPKAATVHARTIQSLVRRGYLPDVRAQDLSTGDMEPCRAVPRSESFHFAGLPLLTLSAPAGEPRPLLKRPQADLEREFEGWARERGARVLRGHRVTGASHLPDGVELTVEGPDGSLTCTGRYLVGADGARSTVRDLFSFTADTIPAGVSALMGMVRFPNPAAVPRGWHRTPRGWTVARVDPDGMGLIRTLDCTGPSQDRDTALTVTELSREASRIAGHDIPMADPVHLTRFSDYTRLAHQFRQGRVFLAGDAAHVHFPIGGQGLSTGLLDGLNLAWKLAHTVRGTAGKGLLDTYNAERRPAAQSVIDNTRAQLALMRGDTELEPLRSVFASLLSLDEANRLIGGLISGQDTAYPARSTSPSGWEGKFLPNLTLVGGVRPVAVSSLLREGRPLLLSRGEGCSHQSEARGWRHVLRTVAVQSPLPCEALVVRPDGYVAWGSDGSGLAEALTDWFGEPRS
jgi:2-polyprenyl-6-methoxyphenol hydroxylase-like FAD-dependent oxidoreductase